MKLHFARGTVALAPMIVLEEIGADYQAIPVNFREGEQLKPIYHSINPKGRVPALVTDAGTLTETPAILAYLAQTNPQAELAPQDPFAFAQVQAFNAYLASTVHVAHAHGPRGTRWVDASEADAIAAMKRHLATSVASVFQLIEDQLDGPWVRGAQYTICDAYLFTIANWLDGDGIAPDDLPHVRAHNQRMRARPAVERALAIERQT